MKPSPVHLGFEIGTGAPVTIEPAHMAITGQTQQSGKTTTLEALVTRSNRTALTFITKRGEGSFATGRRVQPYFRDRADWMNSICIGVLNALTSMTVRPACRSSVGARSARSISGTIMSR